MAVRNGSRAVHSACLFSLNSARRKLLLIGVCYFRCLPKCQSGGCGLIFVCLKYKINQEEYVERQN